MTEWKCPKLTLGGVPLTAQEFSWSLLAGVLPYKRNFTIFKGELADKLHALVNPVSLEIEVTGGIKGKPEVKRLRFDNLYIQEFRGVSRYMELVMVTDTRFTWRGKKIYCNYNKTRIKNERGRTGIQTGTNDPAKLRAPFDLYAKGRYLEWSLRDKEVPYTVKEILELVLEQANIKYVKKFQDTSYVIENVHLNGIDIYRGLEYLLHLSRLSLGIEANGDVYIYSRDFYDDTKLNALALVQNEFVIGPGNIYKSNLKRIRPALITVKFEKLKEVRLIGVSMGAEYLDQIITAKSRPVKLLPDPPVYTQLDINTRNVIACENILRNPYPMMVAGKKTEIGEWITIYDFLKTWGITEREVREQWHGERLVRTLALKLKLMPGVTGTVLGYEYLANHLVSAIKQNYRQTYRIEEYYMAHIRKWVARRSVVINNYDHYNPRSPLWADYCVIPHARHPKISKRTAVWATHAYNWIVTKRDLYRQRPTAGTISVLDQKLGIFRIFYPPELGDGVIQRFFPFALNPLPVQSLSASINMLRDCHLTQAHTLETIISVIWDTAVDGKFNGANKYYPVIFDFSAQNGTGPNIEYLSFTEQARYSTKQLNERGQVVNPLDRPINLGIINAVAQAEAAKLMNQFIDRYTGLATFTGIINHIPIDGPIKSITYSFSSSQGLRTRLDLRRLPFEPTLEQTLSQDTIDYLHRHVDTGDSGNMVGGGA